MDQFAKRVVAIDGGMVVSDKTGGYYQRPDLTKLTEAAVQQATASARHRKVLAQELGVAVEEEAPIQDEAPVREESRPEEEMPRETVFNIDDLLHFDEQENGGRA